MHTVESLKAWCLENYEKGADTMVECWETSDYEEMLTQYGEDSLAVLQRLAGIYEEQQADARYHRNS
jgi:hypothetical protein